MFVFGDASQNPGFREPDFRLQHIRQQPLHCPALFSLKNWRFQNPFDNTEDKDLTFGIIEGILKSPNFEGEKCWTVERFDLQRN